MCVHHVQLLKALRFGGSDDGNPGYVVKYPDGYISWSPKDVFEQSYMQVQEDPKLISGVLIGEHMVNDFISYTKTSTVGYKTVMVRCVLRNGFEIIETSTCVDAQLGEEICMKKIKDTGDVLKRSFALHCNGKVENKSKLTI